MMCWTFMAAITLSIKIRMTEIYLQRFLCEMPYFLEFLSAKYEHFALKLLNK